MIYSPPYLQVTLRCRNCSAANRLALRPPCERPTLAMKLAAQRRARKATGLLNATANVSSGCACGPYPDPAPALAGGPEAVREGSVLFRFARKSASDVAFGLQRVCFYESEAADGVFVGSATVGVERGDRAAAAIVAVCFGLLVPIKDANE